MITVRDLMTPVVQTLSAGDTLAQADRQMKHSNIRHLPVVDGEERLIGLVTHRMVLAAWVGHFNPLLEKPGEVAEQVPIEMIMEKNVIAVSPDMPAAEAARIMETRKFGCLPVIEHGKLAGILTESDFMRFAREYMETRT